MAPTIIRLVFLWWGPTPNIMMITAWIGGPLHGMNFAPTSSLPSSQPFPHPSIQTPPRGSRTIMMRWTLPSSLRSRCVSHSNAHVGHQTHGGLRRSRVYAMLFFRNVDAGSAPAAREDKVVANAHQQALRQAIATAKRDSWRSFCKEATEENLWSAFKKVTRARGPQQDWHP